MLKSKPKVLLFDLGGVIMRWRGVEEMGRLTSLSRSEVITRFETSQICKSFEIGGCTPREFISEMIRLYDLALSPSEFRAY